MRGRADLNAALRPRFDRDTTAQLIGFILCLVPLFVLTLRGWGNIVLFAGMLMCGAFLWLNRRADMRAGEGEGGFWVQALLFTMAAPTVAVVISSLLQANFYSSRFDSVGRSLIAIPILLFVMRTRFDAARTLQYVLPVTLAWTLAHQYLMPQPHKWGADRMATYFADPLVFGYISLGLGLMCLMSIRARAGNGGDAPWLVLAKAVGALLGVYLSIKSGSRTGWLALPVVLAIWLHLNWGRAVKRWAELAVLAAVLAACAAVFYLSDTVHTRLELAIHDLLDYPWTGVVKVDTSVGLRITFLRIASDLFLAHPWAGIGDTKNSPLAQLAAFPYATPAALNTAFTSGFHNEIVTNAVRSGVWGLIAHAALLFVPLVIFARHLRDANAVARRNAAAGIAFSICIVVSSLTTEVLDLKYTASFYAVMIALLCGATLARHGQE